MLNLSPDIQFAELRDISDNVTDYLDRELYIDTFGAYSDYQVNDVLQECYAILIQELTEYGITFTCDPDYLLDDFYLAHKVYQLRYCLDAVKLRMHFITYSDDIQPISQLLDDSENTNTLESVFFYLLEAHPEDARFQEIEDILPLIVANQRFNDHVTAVIKNILDTGENIIIPDIARAQRYIQKTRTLRKLATEAVDKIMSALPIQDWDLTIIKKILNDYDLDKISPDQIKIYSLIDLDEVSPFLLKYKKKMLDIHHLRSQHHIEYWLDPNKQPRPIPTKENLMLLVAHHNEPDTTAATFWQEIREMIDKATEILTYEQVQLIEQMAACVFPKVDENI